MLVRLSELARLAASLPNPRGMREGQTYNVADPLPFSYQLYRDLEPVGIAPTIDYYTFRIYQGNWVYHGEVVIDGALREKTREEVNLEHAARMELMRRQMYETRPERR